MIPDWARVGFDLEEDAKRYTLSANGIVVVEKGRNLNH